MIKCNPFSYRKEFKHEPVDIIYLSRIITHFKISRKNSNKKIGILSNAKSAIEKS
jgi:hypothetical protein